MLRKLFQRLIFFKKMDQTRLKFYFCKSLFFYKKINFLFFFKNTKNTVYLFNKSIFSGCLLHKKKKNVHLNLILLNKKLFKLFYF